MVNKSLRVFNRLYPKFDDIKKPIKSIYQDGEEYSLDNTSIFNSIYGHSKKYLYKMGMP